MKQLGEQRVAGGDGGQIHAAPHSLHALGDGWVVADQARDRLLVLNTTARLIWDRWQQGEQPDAIAAALARRFAVQPEQVAADVYAAIADWERNAPAPDGEAHADSCWPAQQILDLLPPAALHAHVADYRIHDLTVRVHAATGTIHAALTPLLGHLRRDGANDPATHYHLDALHQAYRLRQGCRVIYQGPSLDLATVWLLHELQLAAYRERDNLCVLHAAAVGQDDRSILFPGIAGAGKSTLTAALLHAGFDYLSDDTVPIDAASGYAVPLTPPLCIKAGSVDVLSDRYPQLPGLPVYQRLDQPVRYLPPPTAQRDACPVTALVFPCYRPGNDARLEEIPTTQAFTWLVEAGVFAHRPRDPAHLAALIEWFDGLPSYALSYDDLDDACQLVSEAFAARRPARPQASHVPGTPPARTAP